MGAKPFSVAVGSSAYGTAGLSKAAGPSRAAEAWIKRDRAAMLYSHAPGALIMTAVTASFLVLMVAAPETLHDLLVWLGAVFAVLALRALDALYGHPSRRRKPRAGRREIAWFAIGVLASAALWALFPLLFFPTLTASRSTAAFVVMAAMAGGSASVLGPSLPLSVAYCSIQLLVPGLVFFLLPGRENKFLGLLSVGMFASMVVSSRLANRSVLSAVRLSRLNQALLARTERQRRQTEAANQQLAAAQVALAEANQMLEQRIELRTADLAREMAKRQRYADALTRIASTDSLTGLCNRTTFAQRLGTMLLDAADTSTQLALLFLDLDNFKQVNDVRGHEAGDEVLQRSAHLLGETAGADVLIARWGGDEFVVALPAANRESAAALADTLRTALMSPLRAGPDAIRLDATIGIAMFPQDGQTEDELIRAADVAMYQAKKEGKSRVRQFDRALAQDLARRHLLEQAMRGAAERGEFSLAFQPIISASTGECRAVEALLRWELPEFGAIDPSVSIPVAEQTGQIGAVGRWVLRRACLAAVGWPDPAPAVTVNVSVAQVLSGTLEADVAEALAQSGLPPRRLQLEITESMFVSDHHRVAPAFERLRSRGHRILLDDFGTGFSSLAYLGSLPIDVIKIDQSFVRVAEQDDYAIIRAILSMARALSLLVTAEGVETEAQERMLKALGVDYLQGYRLARPMASTALPAWLDTVTGCSHAPAGTDCP